MSGRLRFLLPPAIVLLGLVAAFGLVRSRKKPETRPVVETAPLVRVVAAEPVTHRFRVASQGTVEPRTEIALTAEVSGRVVSVSPALASGGSFRAGEPLVVLEPVDYEAAVAQAKAALEQAKVRLAQEEAQAAVALDEWKELGDGDAPPLAARELQLAEARAAVGAAEGALRRAEKNLERTRIAAPFDGRVREKLVDIGQFVGMGTPVARVYAIDYAEIRLPLSGDDAAFVDLPLRFDGDGARGPEVLLTADFAGRDGTWRGRIVRTEGAIDPRTRVLYAVARVDDPFVARGDDPPLAVGQFVTAAVAGRTVENAFVLPRAALRGGDRVLVVDAGNRIRYRPVRVLRGEGEDVIVGDGLAAGDRVCVSPLAAVVDGMTVRVAGDGETAAGAPAGAAAPAADGENGR